MASAPRSGCELGQGWARRWLGEVSSAALSASMLAHAMAPPSEGQWATDSAPQLATKSALRSGYDQARAVVWAKEWEYRSVTEWVQRLGAL